MIIFSRDSLSNKKIRSNNLKIVNDILNYESLKKQCEDFRPAE